MANLKDTTIDGSLIIKSTDGLYNHNVANELETSATIEYLTETLKNALTWVKLADCTGGTSDKSLSEGCTWNNYKELLLTVGVWLGGNENATSRILASTLIPVNSSITDIYGTDSIGRYQVVYDTTKYYGGFNILSESTYQLIAPNNSAYIALWAR